MQQEQAAMTEEEFKWTPEKVVGAIGLSTVAFLTFYPVLIGLFLAEVSLLAATIGGSAFGVYYFTK